MTNQKGIHMHTYSQQSVLYVRLMYIIIIITA